MALGSRTVWEIRTNGSDTNGGGFDSSLSGTDYSQQTSPQVVYSDLVIDATTNTNVTSVGTPFTSAHVGNIINVTGGSGFTLGWYCVNSVAGGIATLDRAVGTTSSTGGTGNLGGCLQSFTKVAALFVSENRVWVKTGVYKENFTSGVYHIFYYGYNLVRGDKPTGTSRPLLDGTGLSHVCTVAGSCHWFNIRFANSTSRLILGGANINLTFHTCKLSNCASDAIYDNFSNLTTTFFNTEVSNNSGWGYTGNGNAGLQIIGSYFHNNTSGGLSQGAGQEIAIIMDSIFSANSGTCISNGNFGTVGIVKNSIFYANTGGSTDCIGFGVNTANAGPPVLSLFYNNIFSKNGRYAISNTQSNQTYEPYILDYNMYFANGSGPLNGTYVVSGSHDTTINDPHFVDPTNNNYTYDSQSVALTSGFSPLSDVLNTPFIVNRGIDQGDKRWVWGVGTLVKDIVHERGGSGACVAITPTGGSNVPMVWEFLVPATDTVAFILSFYHQITSGFNGSMTVSIYDINDASPLLYQSVVSLVNDGAYHQFTAASVTPTTPSGLSGNALFCRCVIKVYQGSVAGTVYIDDIGTT